ncbi:hypothetical protein AAFX91_41215 [Bradyrhizobium sp. 31Argb]|uniref:hypothetical protein n=1 Tax=Bradyrhizobium sp. 31Argb TaxID=3141247 RepID=UPI00374A0B37
MAHDSACRIAVRACLRNPGYGSDRDGAVPAKQADAKWPARNDVLDGLTLRGRPPKDMPMPMVTRVTARRSS